LGSQNKKLLYIENLKLI